MSEVESDEAPSCPQPKFFLIPITCCSFKGPACVHDLGRFQSFNQKLQRQHVPQAITLQDFHWIFVCSVYASHPGSMFSMNGRFCSCVLFMGLKIFPRLQMLMHLSFLIRCTSQQSKHMCPRTERVFVCATALLCSETHHPVAHRILSCWDAQPRLSMMFFHCEV